MPPFPIVHRPRANQPFVQPSPHSIPSPYQQIDIPSFDFPPPQHQPHQRPQTPFASPFIYDTHMGDTPVWPEPRPVSWVTPAQSVCALPSPYHYAYPATLPGSVWSQAACFVTPVQSAMLLPQTPLWVPKTTPASVFAPSPHWEPGTFPPEELGTAVPMRLHPHLIYNPVNPLIPILQWDILHRAEMARVWSGQQILRPLDLKADAVSPGVSKIWISTDHPTLGIWMETWGPIMVEKKKISVRDVLDAIYEYFQRPLKKSEIRRITDSGGSVMLNYAAQQRAADSYDELYGVSMATGFRRVDAIGGHRRFQGLRPVVFQDYTWKMYLGLLPGPVPRVR